MGKELDEDTLEATAPPCRVKLTKTVAEVVLLFTRLPTATVQGTVPKHARFNTERKVQHSRMQTSQC